MLFIRNDCSRLEYTRFYNAVYNEDVVGRERKEGAESREKGDRNRNGRRPIAQPAFVIENDPPMKVVYTDARLRPSGYL